MAKISTESVTQIHNIVPIHCSHANKKYHTGTIVRASTSAHLVFALTSNVGAHRHQIAQYLQTKIVKTSNVCIFRNKMGSLAQ